MGDPYVRALGSVTDMDGSIVHVGEAAAAPP